MTTKEEEMAPERVYLSADERAGLINRLYTEPVSRKAERMAELDARYYPVAAPQTISKEELQKSVKRQVDDEMEQRRQRRAEMDARADAEAKGTTSKSATTGSTKLSKDGVEASVQRLYDDTLERKKANMLESQKRYAYDPSSTPAKQMSKEEFQTSVERMSKPKKTEYTTEEVNKVYGL